MFLPAPCSLVVHHSNQSENRQRIAFNCEFIFKSPALFIKVFAVASVSVFVTPSLIFSNSSRQWSRYRNLNECISCYTLITYSVILLLKCKLHYFNLLFKWQSIHI